MHDARAFHRDFFLPIDLRNRGVESCQERGGLNRHIYVRVFFSFLSWDFAEASLVLLVGLTRNGLLLSFFSMLLLLFPPFFAIWDLNLQKGPLSSPSSCSTTKLPTICPRYFALNFAKFQGCTRTYYFSFLF